MLHSDLEFIHFYEILMNKFNCVINSFCNPEVAEEDHWEPREEEGLGGGPVDFTAEGPAALRKPPARGPVPHSRVG